MDQPAPPPPHQPATAAPQPAENSSESQMVMVVYVLYLVGLAIGITSIIGVILAHLRMRDSTGWMHSHYRWQIRTFWFALLWSVIGLALAAVLVGVPILIGVCIWIIYRCVRGLMLWSEQKPTPIGDA